jgi:hypothetical protein
MLTAACGGAPEGGAPGADAARGPAASRFEAGRRADGLPEQVRRLCQGVDSASAGGARPLDPGAGARVPFAVVRHELESGFDVAAYCVARSAEEWKALAPLTSARPYDAPPADFDRETVIVAAMGRQPKLGYDMEVDSVTAGEGTVVFVRRELPTSSILADMAPTPVEVIRVPRRRGPVHFVERSVNRPYPEADGG